MSRGLLLLLFAAFASALRESPLQRCPKLDSSAPGRFSAALPARGNHARPGSVASILPNPTVTSKIFGTVPITEATTFGISLIATSPGFKDFAHFFSSGYGAAMFAMAAASLSTTMITTPAAMVHNLGCAVHGARLYHFVSNRDSWKERDENMAKLNARFGTQGRAKVWVAYSALYALLYTPCLAHIRNPEFVGSLIPARARMPIAGAGLAIQWAGLALEARADHVKQAHKGAIKADRKVKDTWLDKGIYSKTRHPNYLGEGMVHVGSFLCGLPAMNGAIQVAAAAVGAAGITVSLKAGAKKYDARSMAKYGRDKKYKEYVAKTGSILPKL